MSRSTKGDVVTQRSDARPSMGLWAFLIKRVLTLALTFIGTSIVVFVVMNVLPGTPAEVILGTQATPASVARLTAKLGLDRPLILQYLHWFSGFISGHLGDSYISGRPIAPDLSKALSVNISLVGGGLLCGLIIAVPLGILAALRYDRGSGLAISSLSQIGVALPSYVVGLLLVILFAVKLKILPAGGFSPPTQGIVQWLRSLILPCISLGVVEGAILTRYIRSSIIEVMSSEFLRSARAKGLTPGRALLRHGLRNASGPVLTVFGLEFSGLIIGSVVVESVFAMPGLGSLLLYEVGNRDIIVTQDIVMLVATAVLVTNLLVDLLYRVVDPRLSL